jgi:cytidine deaminase
VDLEIQKELIQKATKARENAYAPYSKFPVGSAALTKSGKIYAGCNVENASYGLSNCAERTAIFKAVSEEENIELEAIAIVADTEGPCMPCGSCRQVMAEFGKDNLKVIMSNLSEDILIKELNELLWGAFNKEALE